MIAQNFETAGMPPMACDIYTPDFIAIAKGYGCQALRASNLQELQAALQGSQMAEVPVLIELVESDFIDD
jgi:acetolactate synthase-1/2/3 large subunit